MLGIELRSDSYGTKDQLQRTEDSGIAMDVHW